MNKRKVIKIAIWTGIAIVSFFLICILIAIIPIAKNERVISNALENNIPVEDVHPENIIDAEKLATSVECNRLDTVFLGYYLNMNEQDAIALTKKNIKEKKLKKGYRGGYLYNMHVFDGNEEVTVPFELELKYHNNRLYEISLWYGAFAHFQNELVLPYENAVSVLESTLRDKFLGDGRIRYEYGKGVLYYKGNTRIDIGKNFTKNNGEMLDDFVSYHLFFEDCRLKKLAKKAAVDKQKEEKEEKLRQDSLTIENLKNKAEKDF